MSMESSIEMTVHGLGLRRLSRTQSSLSCFLAVIYGQFKRLGLRDGNSITTGRSNDGHLRKRLYIITYDSADGTELS